MSQVNWLETLGWGEDELDDLRFVGYSYIKQGKYDTALTFFEALIVLSKNHSYKPSAHSISNWAITYRLSTISSKL